MQKSLRSQPPPALSHQSHHTLPGISISYRLSNLRLSQHCSHSSSPLCISLPPSSPRFWLRLPQLQREMSLRMSGRSTTRLRARTNAQTNCKAVSIAETTTTKVSNLLSPQHRRYVHTQLTKFGTISIWILQRLRIRRDLPARQRQATRQYGYRLRWPTRRRRRRRPMRQQRRYPVSDEFQRHHHRLQGRHLRLERQGTHLCRVRQRWHESVV
jgi:hypothetical protein